MVGSVSARAQLLEERRVVGDVHLPDRAVAAEHDVQGDDGDAFRSIRSGGRYEVLSVTTATGDMRAAAYSVAAV